MSDRPIDANDPTANDPPAGGSGAGDWAEWFDANFGPPAAERRVTIDTTPAAGPRRIPVLPPPTALPSPSAPPAGDRSVGDEGVDADGWSLDESSGEPDATPVAAPIGPARRRGWPRRAARRIVRRPVGWCTRPWSAARIVRTVVTVVSLAVTTWVMMQVVHLNPLDALFGIGPRDLIFLDRTPAGGDMGAHVWGPAYLRDVLLPDWQLSGWSMDWYAGLPVYRFYMVVPALAIVALDTVLPYGVAFKVVAMSGMVSLPFCCWAFGRLARFRYPLPELFAFAGLCFALNESYSIWGGNVKSTMAGEFSFSIALSLMMLGLGFLCRSLDDGRFVIWASALLALACLCHGIVLIYTALAAIVIVVCRCGADLLAVVRRALARRDDTSLVSRPLVATILAAPVAAALALVGARWWDWLVFVAGALVVVTIVAVVVVCSQIGTFDVVVGRFGQRLTVVGVIALFTLLFSAFWVGPFLFNHQYMTDMKYGFRPDSRIYTDDSYWDLFFDQKLALDVIINVLAAFGLVLSLARRHVYGVALGVCTLAGVALTYLAHGSLPIIGLLWNPRVLPFVYLMRYLTMMVGAVELIGLLVNAFRNRPAFAPTGAVVRTTTAVAGGLIVLIVFGWVYQVLPGAGFVTKHGERVYAWGPFAAPDGQNRDAQGDSWTAYNWKGYEDKRPYPEYHDLIETMAALGADPEHGCGRALWERDQRENVGNSRYGSSMALMLLPFWTDGCIASSEGLFFEASGTTPYHFLTAAAISENAGPPVRQLRSTLNDAAVGVPYLQALGIRYLMVTTDAAVAEAAARPELTEVATSGPWHVYRVADAEVVEPLAVQPVVVNERPGDQRECWLEVGTSWFQQPDEWAARPATDGPPAWQRIDVAVDTERQIPEDQDAEGCGDPQSSLGRKVNIVVPADEIEPVVLDPVTVSNVVIAEQSVSFDVSQVGVPVLVKVSYFPNWEVTGAEGPYRIAPNFMVVVPTDTHVELTYGRSTSDLFFDGLTLLGIVGAFAWRIRKPSFDRLGAGAGTEAT